MGESDKINHTQMIVEHSATLSRLTTTAEHNSKQINALYELLNRMDVKLDDMKSDIMRLKTERNVAVWIAGSIAGLLASALVRLFVK